MGEWWGSQCIKVQVFFTIKTPPPSSPVSFCSFSPWPSFGIWSWLEDQPLEGPRCQPRSTSIATQRAPFVTSYFQSSRTQHYFIVVSVAGVTSWWWPCLPVVPPNRAPAAVVDRHTAGSQTSPFTSDTAEFEPTNLQGWREKTSIWY